MHTLRDKLNLKIDDLGDRPSLNAAVKAYTRLLSDYLLRLRQDIVVHTRDVYHTLQVN